MRINIKTRKAIKCKKKYTKNSDFRKISILFFAYFFSLRHDQARLPFQFIDIIDTNSMYE